MVRLMAQSVHTVALLRTDTPTSTAQDMLCSVRARYLEGSSEMTIPVPDTR